MLVEPHRGDLEPNAQRQRADVEHPKRRQCPRQLSAVNSLAAVRVLRLPNAYPKLERQRCQIKAGSDIAPPSRTQIEEITADPAKRKKAERDPAVGPAFANDLGIIDATHLLGLE